MTGEKTILIVEDVEINRNILKRILTAKKYKVLEAENGAAAMKVLLEARGKVSLVLLDLSMPVMDGYTMLQEMKKAGLLTAIPVIVTTASEDNNAELLSLEYGASDFITKPYNPEVVCHRIESIIRLCDNAEIINRLEIDHLTKIYSREAFFRHAEILLAEHPDEQFKIVCCNIENFKMINSKYGIRTGDELLRFVAKRCKELRGESGVCGRIGGDSFAILCQCKRIPTQAEIGQSFEKTYKNAPVSNFTIKYGVYPVEDISDSVAEMCDRAQIAMATIKHKYGLYYAVYDDALREKITREHQLTDCMEQALSQKQFVVYLQPKHDVETGEIAGAEALVRWIHPTLGFVSPGEFIPLFEKNGFVSKLDYYIWEQVCALIQGWQKQGRKLIPVSVNASRADFASSSLAEDIVALVDSYGIPRDMLHIEVTESAYTEDPEQIIAAISALRAKGFLIEMDDFGSGYSSLNMLSELPIDILKLDMRFMQAKTKDTTDGKRSILNFVVNLSKWLQLPTVAEGVETEDEVTLLRSMGCNYIQGFFYAKPMPVKNFEAYMLKDEELTKAQGDALHKPLNMHRPSVLVVEDIEANREILGLMLKPYYSVILVSDGEQAFEYIRANHGEISCILLDLLMPIMDGFELIKKMRKEGYLDEIPVIITSEAGPESELRALHLGADSIVSKPYNSEILLHHVKKAVNERTFRKLIGG